MSGRTDVRPAPLPGWQTEAAQALVTVLKTRWAQRSATRVRSRRRPSMNFESALITFMSAAACRLAVMLHPLAGFAGSRSVELNPGTVGLTLFQPSGYRRMGDPGFAPTILSTQERQITDVLNLVRGAHTIKLGAEMRWSQFNIFQVAAPNGSFSFTGQFTQNPIDGDGGSSIADELLGLPISSTISSLLDLGNRQHVPSAFIQDDYKVNRRLTLNLGVRYDYSRRLWR